MQIKIHAVDEYKDSKGKTTLVWGVPEFKQASSARKPVIEVVTSCYEDIGTGQRGRTEAKAIRRQASIRFSQEDVAQLLTTLVSWPGLKIEEITALRLINRLSNDLLASYKSSDK